MKIAIVLSTYRRADGSTPKYLKRAIDSIKAQTFKNWKIFLIGDNYTHPEEVLDIIKDIPTDQIVFHNLSLAQERDNNYPPEMLWKFGGVAAVNIGIKTALHEGYDWIAHLDHDDFWSKDHLAEINDVIEFSHNEAAWICTVSEYLQKGSYLPFILDWREIIDFLPRPQGVIHSSVCMNFSKMPLFYQDPYKTHKKIGINPDWLPADAELWKQCAEFIKVNELKSYCINKVTCFHLEEGYELKKNEEKSTT